MLNKTNDHFSHVAQNVSRLTQTNISKRDRPKSCMKPVTVPGGYVRFDAGGVEESEAPDVAASQSRGEGGEEV